MKEKYYRRLKYLLIILVILCIPVFYIILDRIRMPPPPQWQSPSYIPGQSWEDYARDFLQQSNQPNGLEHYLNAFAVFSADKIWNYDDILTIKEHGWNQEYPEVEHLLQLNQYAIHQIKIGLKKNHIILPPAPYEIGEPWHSTYTIIEQLVDLFILSGLKMESEQKYNKAVDYYLTGIQFGASFCQENQILSTHMVGLASIIRPTELLTKLLQTHSLTPKDYKYIIQTISKIDTELIDFASPIEHSKREIYSVYYYFSKNPGEMYKNQQFYWYVGKPKLSFILKDNTMKTYFYFNQGKILQNNLNYYDKLLSEMTTKSYREFMKTDWDRIPLDIINNIYIPSISKAYEYHIHRKSSLRLLQLQSAVHLYRLEKKQEPTGLDDLKDYLDPIPDNPTTGQPYSWYIDTTGQFQIASD